MSEAPRNPIDDEMEDPVAERERRRLIYTVQVALAALLAPLPADSIVDLGDALRRAIIDVPVEIPMRRDSPWEALMEAAGGVPRTVSPSGLERHGYADMMLAFSGNKQGPKVYRYWLISRSDLLARREEIERVAKTILEGGAR